MSLTNNFWVLRQNYAEKTNQPQMRNLILSQEFITCPWGGWGKARQNVIDGVYNNSVQEDRPGRPSRRQDIRFVEDMKIGDIVLIPFTNTQECIVARITSNVEYSINSGLFWREHENQIILSENDGLPFRPVGRHIEIIKENFVPNHKLLGRMSLSKMNNGIIEILNI
jgi:hypothetical protein